MIDKTPISGRLTTYTVSFLLVTSFTSVFADNHIATTPDETATIPSSTPPAATTSSTTSSTTPSKTTSSTPDEKKKNKKEEELPSIGVLEGLDEPRQYIGQQIVSFADWVDTFFAGDRAYDELQESHVKLYLLQTHFEDDKPKYDARIKAKIILPKTQKRLKLLIESDGEDVEEEAQQKTVREAVEEQDQSVGLRLINKETQKWRVNTDVLVRFRPEAEYIARLRLRRKGSLGSWLFRFSENIFWYSIDGFGETTKLDFDHRLTEKLMFRSASKATWRRSNEYFTYGQDFLLFQNINKRKAITYQAGLRGNTEDKAHTTDYLLSVRYREQIHKNWLFYEIIPGISYPIEDDFKPTRYISLKLEIVFDDK